MASFNPGMEHWRNTLAQRLPTRLRSVFQASARNNLLKQVNVELLVFNDRLYDLRNGSWRQLELQGSRPDAVQLAQAAAQLLGEAGISRAILLLLPAHEFLATSVLMPGVARESLQAALELQAHALLPAFDENLELSVNTQEHETEQEDVALWITARRLNELFRAFSDKGMFLACVMPRMLSAPAALGDVVIADEDAWTRTRIHYRNGFLVSWLQSNLNDLQQEEFRLQWEELTATQGEDAQASLDFRSADDYLAIAGQLAPDRQYSFIPAGAETLKNQMQKGRRLGVLAIAAAMVLLLAFIPFLGQSLQARSLLSNLEQQRQEAAGARADQAAVRAFEQQWGAYTEFPRQNLSNVLLVLQQIINPGVLISFEIDEGFISLEGDSPDPQSLLEQLERNELFTEVDFARATNNQRYYIDLRLATVDFPAYRQWYFPDAR